MSSPTLFWGYSLMGAFIDLTGQAFGRLTVVRRAGTGNTGQSNWECLCECGKTANVLSDNLRRGKQVSCGCYHLETITTHGHSRKGKITPEYRAWQGMKRRCTDVNHEDYVNYGGRGITVCEQWESSFETFLEDMGKKPSKRHSIDRIFTDGNYEPSNCRWSTHSEQTINQRLRKTNTSGHKGITWETRRNKWLAKITLNRKSIHLGNFEKIEDAIEARNKAEIKYHKKRTVH